MSFNAAAFLKTISSNFPRGYNTNTAVAASVQSVITKIFILALNIATSVLTARLLGPEGRGEQAALIIWQVFLAGLLTLGLPSSLIYNLKRDEKSASELFGATVLISVLLGCCAAAAGMYFVPLWLTQYSPAVARQAQFLMLNTPVASLMLVCRAALEARGDYAASNRTLLLTPLLTLIGLILLIPANALTPFNSSLMYVFLPLPVTVWVTIRLWRQFRPKLTNFKSNAATLLNYGVRSYGIDLLGAVSAQFDQVLVIGLLTPSAMGMYIVALNLSRMLSIFQASAIMVLFPKVAARPIEEVVELIGRAARISTAVTFLASIGMVVLGPLLLYLLYGGEYMEAVPVLNVLIVEAGLVGTTLILAQVFMAVGRPGTVAVLQGVGVALSVPLMLILIPRYGMLGAGIALLCSAVVRLILVQIGHPLLLKVPAPSLLIKRADIHFLRHSLFG